MASNTDCFIKAITAPPTKLAAVVNDSSINIALESLEGIQSDTAIVMVIDRVDGGGNQTPELMEVVVGTIGVNGLENVVRGVGGKRQAHRRGAVAEVSVASSEQWNRLVTALLKLHNQDGTLKNDVIKNEHIESNAVKYKQIAPNAVSELCLGDAAVTSRVLATGAVKPEHTNFPRACYGNDRYNVVHSNGGTVLLPRTIYQKTDFITRYSNGKFRIDKSGTILLSGSIWIQAATNARPWLTINHQHGGTTATVGDFIDDSSSDFVTFSISSLVIPNIQAGDFIWLTVGISAGSSWTLDGASGRNNSQVLFELV